MRGMHHAKRTHTRTSAMNARGEIIINVAGKVEVSEREEKRRRSRNVEEIYDIHVILFRLSSALCSCHAFTTTLSFHNYFAPVYENVKN